MFFEGRLAHAEELWGDGLALIHQEQGIGVFSSGHNVELLDHTVNDELSEQVVLIRHHQCSFLRADATIAAVSVRNHLPERMINIVQCDAFVFHADKVCYDEQHEAFIVRVQHKLNKEGLVVDAIHEDTYYEAQLRVVLHHLHDVAHLLIHPILLCIFVFATVKELLDTTSDVANN